jgi:hypothetical protein
MMTPEESRVLSHLRSHLMSSVEEIAGACLPAGSLEQARRILWNLEWHGYIIRYDSDTVQITRRGTSVT